MVTVIETLGLVLVTVGVALVNPLLRAGYLSVACAVFVAGVVLLFKAAALDTGTDDEGARDGSNDHP